MKAKQIDRRWIFLLIFIGVALPLIFTIGFKIETTPIVENVYKMIDETPEGSKVIVSFDYDPASKPELQPMGKAVVKHCFEKKLKVIFMAFWPMGVTMSNEVIQSLEEDMEGLVYGEDYVFMGYKAGGSVTMQGMGRDFRGMFPTDLNGTAIDQIPILNDVDNFDNIEFIFSLSAGAPGIKEWVLIGHDTYGRKVAGGVTAVSAPAIMPYVNEQQQLIGLLGGLKAAAEYEYLIKTPGTATSGMDAQSVAHLIIICFILIGNINFFVGRAISTKGRR
jgi:hypothetical protein